MSFDAVLDRFVAQSPVTVLARLTLQRALSPAWVDAVFERHHEWQYTRELLFSTVVELMSLVALGLRPSLHAAAQRALAEGTLGVSLQALYEKINHSEPAVVRALVRESAARLAPVRRQLDAVPPAPWLAGYQVRVLDGNHLPASERRLKPLRRLRAAPLPGLALVLYDPELDLVLDVLPGEDAHAQEQTFVLPLIERAGPGELWIADRNFATRSILAALLARGAAVLFREHAGHPVLTPVGPRQDIGRGETGVVSEQLVECPPPTPHPHLPVFRLREIEVALDTPLESGETVLRLVTTLPDAVDAITVAALYRRRWTIEGMFQRLEAVLHSEVRTLGQPRAALLAFSVAVVAYNVLAVVQAAVTAEAQAAHVSAAPEAEPVPLSMYYVAHEVREHYRGLLIAVAAAVWGRFERQRPAQLARTLRRIAAHVRLEAFRKHPRTTKRVRPRPQQRDGPPSTASPHVATARVLHQHKQRPTP